MKKIILIICSIILLSTTSALAHTDHQVVDKNMNPMTEEYLHAMNEMHQPMMEGVMSSDPDVAFVAGMIPHHQGAIDMAKIELKYGKDPDIRALAVQVIKAQEKEIEFMKKWLEKHQNR
ncbi:DUF305 domain-containing protein [Orbus sturtevantii]|uniref:CopM family metallochaperone n=1 Tax=Orbus sturtevantii TaxID=3074109 RepID=UPI00370D8145